MKEQERKESTNCTEKGQKGKREKGGKTWIPARPPQQPTSCLSRTLGAGMTGRVWAWAHTEQGDLVCCLVFGIPLGVIMGWVTILVMSLDWWR